MDFGGDTWLSTSRSLEKILNSLSWIVSCMPVDIGMLNETAVIRNVERLEEISTRLVEKRLQPEGYSAALVELQIGGQVVHG